ncbi:MAG: hypothetical protein ACTHK0_00165, partial [Ginsengibacter sp.]
RLKMDTSGKFVYSTHNYLTAADSLTVPDKKYVDSRYTSGTATLSAGTVTVSSTAVTTSSKILVSVNTPGGTQGFLSVPTASIVAGSSFVINSSSATETSTVNWVIVN